MRRCLGCFEGIRDDLEVCPFCGFVVGTSPEEAIHMEPGTLLAERYIIGKVIGYGGFGVTYIGWDAKLEQKVAIKEYLPSEFSTRIPGQSRVSVFNGAKNEQFVSGLNKFVDEAKRLSKFQKEDGIVRIFDCIAENDTAYIVMEYLEGETLAERLKRERTIPEQEAINLLMPVMKSLEAVHKEGIIHRDIAPDNIFITTDGQVKLIDFGASRFATTSHSRSLTVIVKPGYSAEEQYRSRSDQGPYTDVYSIAATLYKMITGETPPDALERRAKIENAKKDIITEPHKLNKNITLVTENAILNALNIRIEDRTQTVEQLIADLTSEEPVKRVYGKIKRIDFYRMPMWLKITAPALMVVILTFGILLATGVIKFSSLFKTSVEVPDGYTIVPNIEGSDIEEATAQLKTSNLNYTTGGNVTSEYISANLIVYQDPEGGRIIPINSLVAITISRGNGEVIKALNGISTVPIFIWSEEAQAIADFTTAGLRTTVEYVFDDNVALGQVIRATDAKGNEIQAGQEMTEGSPVVLYVSKGPEGFPMPSVIGMTEADAKGILEEKGLVVFVSYEETSRVAAGTVYSQSIDADTRVTLGMEVTITLAIAPATTTETEAHKSIFATDTPTPTPTNTPTPTPTPSPTPIPKLSLMGDVDIHHEEGTDSVSVSTEVDDYYYSDVTWSSGNSNIVTVSGTGSSATLTWKSRGTTTVTASISGTDVSTSFTVRCWDNVTETTYSWSDIKYTSSLQDISDTNKYQREPGSDITYPTSVYIDYIQYNDKKDKSGWYHYYPASQSSGFTGAYIKTHSESYDAEGIEWAYCNRDGTITSNNIGQTAYPVSPGGNNKDLPKYSKSSGSGYEGRGYNGSSSETGYYFGDRYANIFFASGVRTSETEYAYREKETNQRTYASCD